MKNVYTVVSQLSPVIRATGIQRIAPLSGSVTFPLATVTVFKANTATLATIYANNSHAPLTNPFTADTTGNWDFFAPVGLYDVEFSGAGIATPFTLSGLGQTGPVDNVDVVNTNSSWATIAQAIADLGAKQGTVVVPSSYTGPFPTPDAVPNNITLLDLTHTQNLVGNVLPANIEVDAYNGAGTTNRIFGFGAQAFATGGGTGVAGEGETVGLFGGGWRSAGSRPVWAANCVVQVSNNLNMGVGLEVDVNNNSGVDSGITNNPGDQIVGLELVSGGTNKPLEAVGITSTNASSRWQIGLLVANWQQFGLRIFQDAAAPAVTGPCLYLVPSSNDSAPMLEFRNAADTQAVWQVLQNGTQLLSNNVQIQALDTNGIPRTLLFHGADAPGGSAFLYAGASGNGFLTDNAGHTILQWNPTGVILPNNIPLEMEDTGGTPHPVLLYGGDNSVHLRGSANGIFFENSAGVSQMSVDGGVFIQAATATAPSAWMSIGLSLASTASNGTGVATPANVANFWIINVSGTTYKVPLYPN